MSGNSAVLEFSSSLPPPSHWLLHSCPHCLPCSGWLLSWTLFSLCCFFLCLFVPYFPFSVLFFLSLSISLPAHSLLWYLSCTHLAVTIAPQCESRAQWFISEDCTHYRGQQRGRTHGTCLRIVFPSASLKQQMTATDRAKFPQPAEFLHLNHTLSCLKDCSGWF